MGAAGIASPGAASAAVTVEPPLVKIRSAKFITFWVAFQFSRLPITLLPLRTLMFQAPVSKRYCSGSVAVSMSVEATTTDRSMTSSRNDDTSHELRGNVISDDRGPVTVVEAVDMFRYDPFLTMTATFPICPTSMFNIRVRLNCVAPVTTIVISLMIWFTITRSVNGSAVPTKVCICIAVVGDESLCSTYMNSCSSCMDTFSSRIEPAWNARHNGIGEGGGVTPEEEDDHANVAVSIVTTH